jgi:hypothetical protein
LNALLSLREASNTNNLFIIPRIELFPLTETEITQINHGEQLFRWKMSFCNCIHLHGKKISVLHEFFTLHKKKISLLELKDLHSIRLYLFRCLRPTDQPELWTQAVFENLFQMLAPKAYLITYSSKSVIRKAMEAAGFTVQKIPGPHGKRDMVRARKNYGTNYG